MALSDTSLLFFTFIGCLYLRFDCYLQRMVDYTVEGLVGVDDALGNARCATRVEHPTQGVWIGIRYIYGFCLKNHPSVDSMLKFFNQPEPINGIERKGITLGRLLDQLVERCATVEMVDDEDLLHRFSLCRRLQDA